MMKRKWIELIWVFGLVFMVLSCSQSPTEKRDKYMKRGDEYAAKQELNKAIIEYKNAIQIDPQFGRGHYQLALAYLQSGQPKEAFAELSRAVDLDPNNLEAQLRLGHLYLLGNKAEEAAKKAALILEKEPNNTEAMFLQGAVFVKEGQQGKAKEVLSRILELDSKNIRAYIILARIAGSEKKYSEARDYLKQAVAASPKDAIPRLELARLYEQQGEPKEAEHEIQEAVSVASDKGPLLGELAKLYVRQGDLKKAESTYLQMVELAPDKVGPKMILGGFYISQKNWGQAEAWLKKAHEQEPANLAIETTLASVYLDMGKPEEGQKLIDKVLEKDKGNVPGRLLKAQLLFKQNKLKESAEILDGVLKDQPNRADAHFYRGLIYLAERDQPRAKASLLKAVDYNPDNLNGRAILAEIYVSEGAADLALEQVTAILSREPRNFLAHLIKGNAQLLNRDFRGAQKAYETAAEISPDNPAPYFQLATALRLEGRYDQSLAQLDKVLQLKPDYVPALTMKVSIYVLRKEPTRALSFLDSALQENKENKTLVAVLHELRGSVLFTQQDYDGSEADFKKALEMNPQLLSPYLSLARLYQVKKETEKAKAQYQAVLAKEPKYGPAYMALGAIYDAEGRTADARTMYEKVLELRPDFAPAANNLAWILLQSGQDTDRALELAKKAKAQLPDDANVADTLGLALVSKGVYPAAIAELADAAKKLPQSPTVFYHLGLAQWKNGDKKAAKESVQKALDLKRPFPEEKQAQELLKEIKASK